MMHYCFILEESRAKALYPQPLDDISLQKNEAYSTPIVVIPGRILYIKSKMLINLNQFSKQTYAQLRVSDMHHCS